MARHLETSESDRINREATCPENAAEMRMESQAYRDEIMGRHDWDDEDDFRDDDGFHDREPDDNCEFCGCGISPAERMNAKGTKRGSMSTIASMTIR